MSVTARWLVAGLVVLAGARLGSARCGDRPGDADAVDAVRAQCDCTSGSHADYVGCIAGAANRAVTAHALRPRCRSAVVRCAVRSTCGRAGTVACCLTAATGARRCRITPVGECIPPAGGNACIENVTSCCDACGGGCGASTTTTTVPRKGCASASDCDDANACTSDQCIGGTCQHDCLCVGPGGLTCCPGPAAECGGTRWFYTCGDPVCGVHRDHPGVPSCGPGETAGAPCSTEGAMCDPGSPCNQLLLCATSDPTHGGQCPISRRRYKEDVRYLDARDLRRLRDELMRFPLATYRYKGDPSRTHLGFVIEDVEPSPSVDGTRDMVDLYGYTTMAVAALKEQAREIRALKREVATLRRELRHPPR